MGDYHVYTQRPQSLILVLDYKFQRDCVLVYRLLTSCFYILITIIFNQSEDACLELHRVLMLNALAR